MHKQESFHYTYVGSFDIENFPYKTKKRTQELPSILLWQQNDHFVQALFVSFYLLLVGYISEHKDTYDIFQLFYNKMKVG